MKFLLSGEGITDIGGCSGAYEPCEGEHFQAGPMAIIVDRLTEQQTLYSLLDTGAVRFVSETAVAKNGKQLSRPRSPRLPGKKRGRGTLYFYKNAMGLGDMAKELEAEEDTPVVAVLFRDSDGSRSSSRGLWEDKFNSIQRGFQAIQYQRGVAMVPKPKSEAWLICALKEVPYQHCDQFENASGNDNSPDSLKSQLEEIIGHAPTGSELAGWVSDGRINPERINMPSFLAFREELKQAVRHVMHGD